MAKRTYGLSLFSSAGVGDLYLKNIGIDIAVANEIIPRRARLYSHIHKNSSMIIGDIRDKKIYKKIIDLSKKNKVSFIIATPPCQGFSLVGKNKSEESMKNDDRNFLFKYVVDAINDLNPSYILIENVPRFLSMGIKYKREFLRPDEYISTIFSKNYKVDSNIYNAMNYDTPQDRKRAIIRIYKKNLTWNEPKKTKKISTLKDAIGHLPSIEANEQSKIKWHFGRKHTPEHIKALQKTPTGKSAYECEAIKSKNGLTPKGFATTYSRMWWDKPCPTITIRNDAISSQRNVHPGRKLKNGLYSDARVLSIKELFLLTGINGNFNIPDDTPEILIRQIIGECVPPKLIKIICKGILH